MDMAKQQPAQASKPLAHRYRLLPLGLILLLATLFYFYQLGAESLWLDELFSIRDARQLVNHANSDRPLYYFLLRFWMLFGTSDAWLRSLSILFALGNIVLTYLLGCRVANCPVGIVAALMSALSTLYIYHAQEVRMYMVGLLFSLVGTLGLVRWLKQLVLPLPPVRGPSPIIWWAVGRFLAMLTTPLSSALLGADLMLGVFYFREKRRQLLIFGGVFALLVLLWLPNLLSLMGESDEFMSTGWVTWLNRPKLTSFPLLYASFTTWPLQSPWSAIQRPYSWFLKGYSLVLMGVIVAALWLKPRAQPQWWIALWAVVPQVLFFLVSQVSSSLWVERYLVFTAPYVFLLLAIGGVKIWERSRPIAIALATLYGIVILGGLTLYYTQVQRPDWRSLAQTLQTQEQAGDVFIITSDAIIFKHYYQGELPFYRMENYPTDETIQMLTPGALQQVVAQVARDRGRIWTNASNNIQLKEGRDRVLMTATQRGFALDQQQDFSGVELLRLSLENP